MSSSEAQKWPFLPVCYGAARRLEAGAQLDRESASPVSASPPESPASASRLCRFPS